MNVSDLTLSELAYQLKTTGIYLKTGVLVTHIRSDIPIVAKGINHLYGDYPMSHDEEFADFHVCVRRPWTARRWIKPQVLFLYDGVSAFKPLPLPQAFPMLEWGLNWCISGHVHSYLMIHAAVIEKGGYAAILPAPPGSGKSTLCAALLNRGWRLLSDEITLVRVQDGAIIPMPRPVSLKNQSIDIIQKFAIDARFSEKVVDTVKGTVAHMRPPTTSVLRALEPAKPAWIVFPKYIADAPTRLDSIPQARAFMRVADNAFNYDALALSGFRTLTGLINASQCYDFTYSRLDEAIEIFASLKTVA